MRIVAAFVLLTAAGTCCSLAATMPTTGRITYIDRENHRIMLDNAYMYDVQPGVNLADIAVAEKVRLGTASENGRPVIEKLTRIDASTG